MISPLNHPQLGSKYNSLTSNDSKNNASEHSMGNHNGNIVVQNINSSRITPTVEEMASNLNNSYFPQIISSDNNITVKNSDSVKNLKRMDPNTTSLVLNKTKVEDHIGREFVKAHSIIMGSNNNTSSLGVVIDEESTVIPHNERKIIKEISDLPSKDTINLHHLNTSIIKNYNTNFNRTEIETITNMSKSIISSNYFISI